jgi:hypothetical protein
MNDPYVRCVGFQSLFYHEKTNTRFLYQRSIHYVLSDEYQHEIILTIIQTHQKVTIFLYRSTPNCL